MKNEDIVKWLRSKKVETGSLLCLGCGHEHNCGIHGCAVMRAAADAIENLMTENAALRRTIDNLTSAQAVVLKEFEVKLEELAEVKAGMRWISVKDRLPDRTMPPRDVLVYHDLNCGMFIDRAWYSHEQNKWRSAVGMRLKVTHWMPMPEPPEKEEKTHEKTDD